MQQLDMCIHLQELQQIYMMFRKHQNSYKKMTMLYMVILDILVLLSVKKSKRMKSYPGLNFVSTSVHQVLK